MDKTKRISNEMILGARVWFARIGASVSGDGGNVVSDTFMPEPPESYANPGDWGLLGKIRTSKVHTDYKTADVEGVDDTGAYKITELKLATKRKIQFSTNDVTPEAWQMTFGLLDEISEGVEQQVFASGNDTIEGWMCLEFTDAYRAQLGLARIFLRVKLTLQNPLEAKSDPAQADYEAAVVPNALATFTSDKLTA